MKRLYTLALLLSFAAVASILLLTNDVRFSKYILKSNDTVLRMRKHKWGGFSNPFGSTPAAPTPAAAGEKDYYDATNT